MEVRAVLGSFFKFGVFLGSTSFFYYYALGLTYDPFVAGRTLDDVVFVAGVLAEVGRSFFGFIFDGYFISLYY